MAFSAPIRRACLTGATFAVAAILATACNPASTSSAASPGGSPSAASAAPAAGATSPAPTSPAASPTPPPATSAASGQAAGAPPACATSALKVSIGDGGGGAAGTFYSRIEFTNTSSASCTLYGYPGVSLLDGSGAQIGQAAQRSPGNPTALVTLAPAATAVATLGQVDSAAFPAATCKQVTSATLRVYPPNQTVPAEVSFQGPACSNASLKQLTITAIALAAPGQ